MIYTKHTKVLILLVCLVLGFMLAMQLKTQGRQKTIPVQRAEELSERLRSAEKDRERLTIELESLKNGTNAFDKETERLRALAGESALQGKGIRLTIEDSTIKPAIGENKNLYIIHDEDLLRVINELRAAGAEAISINGQRLTANSEVRCAGPTVVVNEVRLAAPFVISAIGNPQTMESSLKIRGGVLENFKYWGIKADLEKSDQVIIPAAKRGHNFEFAKAVSKDEETGAKKAEAGEEGKSK
jgi:uncharacterized protein YlxW (UPF0749 family)